LAQTPDPEQYFSDGPGLWVEWVGPWVKEKQKFLSAYVQISSGARGKFKGAGGAYIEVFSGPGRSKIRYSQEFVDGSAVTAFKRSQKSHVPFTAVHISDWNQHLLESCQRRLESHQAPVTAVSGPASRALPEIVRTLNPNGLHLVFLDPHNLGALSFDLFESLSKLNHVDVLVHLSISDLRRNADRYSSEEYPQFEQFAPGWRSVVDPSVSLKRFRAGIVDYWVSEVEKLGLPRAKHIEQIKGPNNADLYWLFLLSKHKLAHSFWEKISYAAKAPQLDV